MSVPGFAMNKSLSSFSPADHAYMAQALRLAEKGLYSTSPNPRVGCIVVRDGEVVGSGWHQHAGGPHAEINALAAAGSGARGAAAYVTLEPCSHHGKTPPCGNALIEAGIARVIMAMQDPNPLVAGKGAALLRQAGVEVVAGLMETQAKALNAGFISRMTRQRPWTRLKIAASLDGKTALNNGASQWITSEPARRDGHRLRARSCAVLTGIGTVLADNPELNVRYVETPRQPLRIILDSRLRIPLDSKVLREGQALIFTASADEEKITVLRGMGTTVIQLPGMDGKVDLAKMMQTLASLEINELLVEAGARLNGALTQAGLVDDLVIYLAPYLIGDAARGMAQLPELAFLREKRALIIHDVRSIGPDIRISACPGEREIS
jgi:diaminohydroxyphosphoribosylaminopyrimidine deaminase/5-amino-6-(5-phosphoribosylamino)uracil reductase